LPDQDAVVLIGEGTEPDVWLVVTILNLFRVINLLVLVSGAGHLQNAEPLGNGHKLS
jgi:hypothetical protein